MLVEHLHDDGVVVALEKAFVIVVHMMLGGDLPFMTMLITNVMVVAM